MSEKSVISPFQILDWRILAFNCSNPMLNIPEDIEHQWTIKAHIENIEPEENQLRAIVRIEFHFVAEHEGQQITMDGQCVAMCTMDKRSVQDAESMFQNLLSRTAMTNCLANLRVFLLQAGTLHQMGPKRIMLPFINLNNFTFDETIKITV